MAAERVIVRPAPLCAETPLDALADEITPPGLHYVRSNFPFPHLDARTHRIRVDGAVGEALELGMDELARLPRRTVGVTLECAGNDRLTLAPLPAGELWGGGAVATAEWGGVSLADVLARASVGQGAREVLVEAADEGVAGGSEIRFARSLPMEKALHPDTLLAFEMNGAPVPAEHGAPLRLVVPGWYGMASVKWVSRISVLTEPFAGWFQRDRYVMDYGAGAPAVPVAEMAVKAVVTVPRGGEVLGTGPVTVRGWAWSGAGPVARVQVAVDGGEAWEDARVHP
ncbi:MAG TPA: molybdopterin-dependent oxidoreductase, partial [Longimicrobium sp.]|nr:molybdopterin-dependent oxidoreductase [Longimicrobium sp.]